MKIVKKGKRGGKWGMGKRGCKCENEGKNWQFYSMGGGNPLNISPSTCILYLVTTTYVIKVTYPSYTEKGGGILPGNHIWKHGTYSRW